jgi:hypothetical protein
MAINYYTLVGGDKRLNEVVFAGSHDAGIAEGKWFVKTQSLGIGLQAVAGVRIFDLRIAATTVSGKENGVKKAELKTYHGGLSKKVGATRDLGNGPQIMDRFKGKPGTKFGAGLEDILNQAKAFVLFHPTEFLLLKFDHCKNWDLIAEACCELLDGALYQGTGNINNKTLDELKGKVVVLFSPDGLQAIDQILYTQSTGIHGIRSLYSKDAPTKTYIDDYPGLQYIGKGGTSAMNLKQDSGKIKENIKKQTVRLGSAVGSNPDVMGMMYWTTTGALGSIKSRNKKMWKGNQPTKMKELWYRGLQNVLTERFGTDLPLGGVAQGTRIKMFMPNFVMIDFADPTKCQTIADLNRLAATSLANLYDMAIESD